MNSSTKTSTSVLPSTTTTITSTSIQIVATFNVTNVVNFIDYVVRCYGLVVHLLYFIYLIFKKDSELRLRSYFILHNVNVTTLLVALVYTAYIPSTAPFFPDAFTNQVLCRLTEIFWMWMKYARVYALLLLALYRYIGSSRLRLYNFINCQGIHIFMLIFFTYVISLVIPTIVKFSLQTTYSIYFCTDGFAPNSVSNFIAYYVVNTILSSILPTIVIFIIYASVYCKLRQKSVSLKQGNSNKVSNFATQFVVLNVITSIATFFSTFIDFINVVTVNSFSVGLIKK